MDEYMFNRLKEALLDLFQTGLSNHMSSVLDH
jgi:hypothetical protein